MMKRYFVTYSRLLIFATLLAGCRFSEHRQEAPEGQLASYYQARTIILEAWEALLGDRSDEEPEGLYLEGSGTQDISAEYQGRRPDSRDPQPFREVLAWDAGEDRFAYEYCFTRIDSTRECLRMVYLHDDEMIFTGLVDSFAFHGRDPAYHEARRRTERMTPLFLLREALDSPGGLRHLGRKDGMDQVAMALSSGELLQLSFSDSPRRLKSISFLADLPFRGDALIRWTYKAYRALPGGGAYPSGYRIDIAGHPFREVSYQEAALGATGGTLVFQIPEGIEPPAPPPAEEEAAPARPPRVDTLAPGIFRVVNLRSGFHPIFVEFAEFVAALDAPTGWMEKHHIPADNFVPGATSSSVGKTYLELIQRTVPGKPVRYIVPTHFHSDHAGGLRPFLRAGATVLATSQAQPLYEAAARRAFTLAEGQTEPLPARIEVIEERRPISNGDRTIELIPVGENPHVEEMLVVYFPDEEWLYVADLFEPVVSPDMFPLPSHAPVNRFFAGWLAESGLSVERIYGSHSFRPATREHLERAVGNEQ